MVQRLLELKAYFKIKGIIHMKFQNLVILFPSKNKQLPLYIIVFTADLLFCFQFLICCILVPHAFQFNYGQTIVRFLISILFEALCLLKSGTYSDLRVIGAALISRQQLISGPVLIRGNTSDILRPSIKFAFLKLELGMIGLQDLSFSLLFVLVCFPSVLFVVLFILFT